MSQLRFSRPVGLVVLSFLFGAGLDLGCGSKTANSGSGFGGSSGSGKTSSTGKGGEGGDIHIFTSSTASGAGGTMAAGTGGTAAGTGGSKPVCDGNPTTGPQAWAVKNNDAGNQYALAVAVDTSGNTIVAGSYSLMTTLTFGNIPAVAADAHNALYVAKLDPTGAAIWVKGFPSVSPFPGNTIPYSTARAVATDETGAVYVTGDFSGTLHFGPDTFTSQGNFFADAFVAKLDATGTPVWGVRLGDTAATPSNGGGNQTPRGITVHKGASGDDVAVVGEFETTIDLHNGTVLMTAPNETNSAAFLAVFHSGDGSTEFGMQLGDGSALQSTHAVAYDKNGDILITGYTQGMINFPGGAMLTPTGMQAAFVAKVKGDGSAVTWGKIYGVGTASGEGIASDANGDIFVGGDHQGTIDFGGDPLANMFGANIFVAKLDTTGALTWSYTFGDSQAQHCLGLVVDSTGHAVLAGEFGGKLNFGGGSLVSAGGDDIYVAKLDTHGCQVWAKSFGDPAEQTANGIALDASGNVIIAGSISGTVAFGATMLTAQGTDAFVAKFGP